MGDKYILELEDRPLCVFDEDTQTYFPRLYRVKGFNSLVFDQNGLDKLTPYTEPDLEQVISDAYNDGYKAGREAEKVRQPNLEQVRKELCDKCMNEVEDLAYQLYSSKVDEAYQRGLNNVWEAVKRLNNMSHEATKKIFGCGFGNVLDTLTASEFIERITEYEKKQVKFCAGDEICHKAIPEIKVCVTDFDSDGNWDGFTVDHYSAENIGHVYASRSTEDWMKTGKHYPQIAEMLRKTTTKRDEEHDGKEKVHT